MIKIDANTKNLDLHTPSTTTKTFKGENYLVKPFAACDLPPAILAQSDPCHAYGSDCARIVGWKPWQPTTVAAGPSHLPLMPREEGITIAFAEPTAAADQCGHAHRLRQACSFAEVRADPLQVQPRRVLDYLSFAYSTSVMPSICMFYSPIVNGTRMVVQASSWLLHISIRSLLASESEFVFFNPIHSSSSHLSVVSVN